MGADRRAPEAREADTPARCQPLAVAAQLPPPVRRIEVDEPPTVGGAGDRQRARSRGVDGGAPAAVAAGSDGPAAHAADELSIFFSAKLAVNDVS